MFSRLKQERRVSMSNHFDEHKLAPNVKIIPPNPKSIRKNVAIYCRVSTADKAQLTIISLLQPEMKNGAKDLLIRF